jgi:hypothetical protein
MDPTGGRGCGWSRSRRTGVGKTRALTDFAERRPALARCTVRPGGSTFTSPTACTGAQTSCAPPKAFAKRFSFALESRLSGSRACASGARQSKTIDFWRPVRRDSRKRWGFRARTTAPAFYEADRSGAPKTMRRAPTESGKLHRQHGSVWHRDAVMRFHGDSWSRATPMPRAEGKSRLIAVPQRLDAASRVEAEGLPL